jgi:hypothetical protein
MTIPIELTAHQIDYLTNKLWWDARISPLGPAAKILRSIQRSLKKALVTKCDRQRP